MTTEILNETVFRRDLLTIILPRQKKETKN